MKLELLLERVQSQLRLAVLEDGALCEIYYERRGREKLSGNIYAGRVQNVLPGMNAAFVDIGLSKNAFLYAGDIGIEQQELQQQLQQRRIEKMLRPGQMILAQVVKEPGGSKGPRISGSVTLPGRLTVLIPTLRYAGVSKKITDDGERNRLYAIALKLSEQFGTGVIVRTAGEGASEAEILADYQALLRMWSDIENRAKHSAKPRLVQPDGNLALRAVRDMLTEDVYRLATDDEALYQALIAYAQTLTPDLIDRIQLCKTELPLFDLYRVDHQLESAFDRSVWLKSGGSIVIDETEAMTVIDVNTGKFTGKKSLSETIFRINCEAAQEIARQMRLRDLGGIIIIDFIDMDSEEQKSRLLDVLKKELEKDRNRTNVLGLTALGFVEMTRKKVRRPLVKQLMHDCSACKGFKYEWSYESLAYQAVRELWRRRRQGDDTPYRIVCGEKTAAVLRTIGLPEGGQTTIDPTGAAHEYLLSHDLRKEEAQ